MRRYMAMMLILTLTMLILPLSPATGQDMQEVSEAYERGDYATAIELLRPFAEQGDAPAQRNLGLMHYHGEGVAAGPRGSRPLV